MSKVSILMAVHNGAAFLTQSISSLQQQTFTDWELLVVDDASTDQSLQLLQEWEKREPRIRVWHLQKNKGMAYARNVALQYATGEIITFLDCDDWYDNRTLEQLMATFAQSEETDCVLYRLVKVDADGRATDYQQPDFETLTGEEAFVLSLNWTIHGVNAVRRHIHLQHPYDDRTLWYSDDNATRLHYLSSRRVANSRAPYFYRQHPSSITHQVNIHRLDWLQACANLREDLQNMGVNPSIINHYEEQRWRILIDTYRYFFMYRQQFSPRHRRLAQALMRRAWRSIDTSVLPHKLRFKWGFCPLRPFWTLFVWQEESYFTLRRWCRRL